MPVRGEAPGAGDFGALRNVRSIGAATVTKDAICNLKDALRPCPLKKIIMMTLGLRSIVFHGGLGARKAPSSSGGNRRARAGLSRTEVSHPRPKYTCTHDRLRVHVSILLPSLSHCPPSASQPPTTTTSRPRPPPLIRLCLVLIMEHSR